MNAADNRRVPALLDAWIQTSTRMIVEKEDSGSDVTVEDIHVLHLYLHAAHLLREWAGSVGEQSTEVAPERRNP
jgi:hypothetical protein